MIKISLLLFLQFLLLTTALHSMRLPNGNFKSTPLFIFDTDFKTEKLFPWQKFHKSITHKYTQSGNIVGKLAFYAFSGLLVLKCCSIAHECGHALALKLLFGTSSTLYIPASLIATLHACIHEPVPLGVKSALMYAAGPLAGIAAHYTIVKIEAIINEIINNKKVSCKERILQALKKPFYVNFIRHNQEFTFGITVATLYGLCRQLSQFMPYMQPLPSNITNEYTKDIAFTDGYGILKSLGY
jgi:hypothetical protein